jgi:hypothetical protein
VTDNAGELEELTKVIRKGVVEGGLWSADGIAHRILALGYRKTPAPPPSSPRRERLADYNALQTAFNLLPADGGERVREARSIIGGLMGETL